MESFPSYDYPLWGNTPESAGVSSSPNAEGNQDFPYGGVYGGAALLTPGANATAGTGTAAPPFTLGVVFDDLTSGVKSTVGGAYNAVTGTVKSVYWNLIGGVAIIGIIMIVVLGTGSRFMNKLEGK
jgi:hypothetical protein